MNKVLIATRAAALLWVGLFVSVSSVSAQSAEDAIRYTQRMTATDAWSTGMAGAGKAGFGHSSALINNPAGLGWLASSQINGTLSFFTAENDAVYNPGGTSLSDDVSRTGLSHFSYLYKAPTGRGSLVFGLGLNRTATFQNSFEFSGENSDNSVTDYFLPQDGDYFVDIGDDGVLGTDDDFFEFGLPVSAIAFETYAFDFDPVAYSGGAYPFIPAVVTGTVTQDGSISEKGGAYELNGAVAWEASRDVMIGIGANLSFGDYELRRTFEEIDIDNANDGTGFTTDFDNLFVDEYLDSGLYGFNLRGGVSTAITPFLRLGLTVETPTWYEISEDYGTTIGTEFDNGDYFEYGGLNGDIGTGSFDYRITTPWRLGGGVMLRFGGIRLFGDVEVVDWTQMQLSADVDQDYFDELNRAIEDNYESVVNTKFGGEFVLGRLGIRAGWATTQDARIDPIVERDRNYASFGLGYRFRNGFTLNLGWMSETYDDLYLPYTDLSTFAPVTYEDDPVVTREVVRNFFKVDFGFKL